MYRVQVGAFSNKKNADALLASLKKAGFDGFITTSK
jgi:cell division septation protein DedD